MVPRKDRANCLSSETWKQWIQTSVFSRKVKSCLSHYKKKNTYFLKLELKKSDATLLSFTIRVEKRGEWRDNIKTQACDWHVHQRKTLRKVRKQTSWLQWTNTNGLREDCLGFLLSPFSLMRGWYLGKHSKDAFRLRKQNKMDGDMLNETKSKRRKFVQIITCCEEAKLTVLGTSYAICVDTPPMSRIPAVLFRRMASLLSLPGILTSTTASSSGKNEKHPLEQNKNGKWDLLKSHLIIFMVCFKHFYTNPDYSSQLKSR